MGFLLGAVFAKSCEHRAPGVDAEVMLPLQVVVQGLKVGAVHMADPAAAAALEQHAVPVAARRGPHRWKKAPSAVLILCTCPVSVSFSSWR